MRMESKVYMEIPVGWSALVSAMTKGADAMFPFVSFVQVKEKFGSLRVHTEYAEGTSADLQEEARRFISHFERSSVNICATCGSTNAINQPDGGWWQPKCPEHATLKEETHE